MCNKLLEICKIGIDILRKNDHPTNDTGQEN